MYRKLFISLITGVLAIISFSSCTAEETIIEPDNPGQDKPAYPGYSVLEPGRYNVAFHLYDPSTEESSRAVYDKEDADQAGDKDFVKGDEHEIGDKGNFALFFHPDGGFYKFLKMEQAVQQIVDGDEHKGEVELIYTVDFTVDAPDENGNYVGGTLPNEIRLPLQCLVITNAPNLYDKFIRNEVSRRSLNEMLKLLIIEEGDESDGVTNVGRGNGDKFIMTNSVYVKEGKVVSAVEINEDNIQKAIVSQGEVIDLTKIVHIPIERMSAKVTFEVDGGDNYDETSMIFTPSTTGLDEIVYCSDFDRDGVPIYTLKNWRARLTGWSMNALEQQMYLFKNIKEGVNYFNSWNDETYRRSYWAEDPHYTTGNYPWQYRQAIDYNLDYYEYLSDNNSNTLQNYSYNQRTFGPEDAAKWTSPVYIPENTFDANTYSDNMDGRTSVLVGSHLIVTAELQTDIDNSSFSVQDNLYRDRNGIWYKEPLDALWNLVRNFNNQLSSQQQMDFTSYDWTSKVYTPEEKRTCLLRGHDYCLYYDDEPVESRDDVKRIFAGKDVFIPAVTKNGDGKILPYIDGLTVKDRNTDDLLQTASEIFVTHLDGETLYDERDKHEATDHEIKSLLMEWLGVIDHFSEGRMYYAAPARLTYDNKDYFGVVRNNWYKYILTDIQSLGTPVDNPDEPIVPNAIINPDIVNFTFEIIDWHRIETTAPVL